MPRRDKGEGESPVTRDAQAEKYAYVTGVANSALVSRNALREGDTRVKVQVSESLLREFLVLLEALQEELDQRWNSQGEFDCHADRA